ncbi:molybdopterin-dependent oxidoreductase [Pseudonocardia lacus]|uniref:molybdopterin-dependent oxidoreductase n=1 Tax=Pseudonocardia lacus TaxID=2835865 RepID=UPI0027E2B465|nr:molybdopterin-dependent oxidoreductase [Pseudonocardia lacus]
MTRTGARYGWPAGLWRALERRRPPLPRYRSPVRGPWLTAVLGLVLLVGMPVVVLTGLLDRVAYGSAPIPADVGLLQLPPFDWPTSPAWLFRLTQGTHVLLGLVLVPVVLAKLWSVAPKLTAWPPARSLLDAVERVTVLLLVGSALFEIVTGLLNIQYDYVFGFSFYAAHYVGAWVFIGALVAHVVLRFPALRRGLRSRSLRVELRTPLAATAPDPDVESELVATDPLPPTISRRGALALVGGGSLLVAGLSVGQVLDGPLRSTALLLPRGRTTAAADGGPNDFPVNRTFAASGIDPAATGAAWRLELAGARTVLLDRSALAAMARHTVALPIACVEGWSTEQTWTGLPLRDLAALAGLPSPTSALVRSIEQGPFAAAELTAGQVLHPDALLALRVNGADLSPDHGFPARIVVPALPGVRCTKWVGSIAFRGA